MSKPIWPCMPPKEAAAELLRSCRWEMADDPASSAHKAAYYLFQELIECVGVGRAKYIFRHFGKLPSKTDLSDRKNYAVLDRFDRGLWDERAGDWRPCSMLALAKLLAKENEALPLEERKGPGGIEVTALAKHIENLVKRRDRELDAGTWFGPITPEQAMRHFGTQNVATSSEK
jgi:hypothetical protein